MRMVLGVVAGGFLGGCASGPPLPPVPLTPSVEAEARQIVARRLKDPQAAQFEDLRAGRRADGTTVVCGFVNAKNSFGGYVGFQPFAVDFPASERPYYALESIAASAMCTSYGLMMAR